eukprot:m.14045 g.14045  ORF g.14045 m.14045 type:complete len:126 (-) comp6326_c1_seq1:228-605(-)
MASCAKCSKPFGPGKPVAKLLGKSFHKECVVCKDCNVSLIGKGMVDGGGWPQCEACAEKAEAAVPAGVTCKGCKKEISGTCTKAYGFTFHVYCMSCCVCKKPITNDGFYDDVTDKILHLECLTKL